MKIGDRVAIREENAWLHEFIGRTGTIVKEHIPDSQAAMLSGISKWEVKFDEPIHVCQEVVTVCEFYEHELELI